MRIGLLYGLGPQALDAPGGFYDEALDQIAVADAVGIDFVLFEEHRGALGSPGVTSLAAAAAARTKSIRVGAANLQPALNHPVRVAEDWAVVDLISRGRAILGLSAGERDQDFLGRGVDWEARLNLFREAVELIRTAWTQNSFQFIGEHIVFPLDASGPPGWRREPYEPPHVDQWRRGQVIPQYLPVTPKPVQMPHPPIWLTGWRREEIEWAGRGGFSFLFSSLLTEDELRDQVRIYTDALEASGRDVREVDVAVAREVFVAQSAERAREAALGSLMSHLATVRSEAPEGGGEREVLDKLIDEEKLLETCFVVGSVTDVVGRLKQLQSEIGVTHLICRLFLPGRKHQEVIDAIRLLASQVATRLVA